MKLEFILEFMCLMTKSALSGGEKHYIFKGFFHELKMSCSHEVQKQFCCGWLINTDQRIIIGPYRPNNNTNQNSEDGGVNEIQELAKKGGIHKYSE